MRLSIAIVIPLIVIIDLTLSTRIKERFKPLQPHLVRCGFPEAFLADSPELGDNVQLMSPANVYSAFKGINLTITVINSLTIGKPDANGSYDGMIGALQRGEVDALLWLTRLDSTPFEPGKFVLYMDPDSSPKIYSSFVYQGSTTNLDVLYLYVNFDSEIWFYYISALVLFSVLCIIITHFTMKNLFSFKRIVCSACEIWWNLFMLLVDVAPTDVSTIPSIVVLWVSIVLAMFYGIHIILMNTMSVDLVASTPNQSIEHLHELLYEEKFSGVKPMVFDMFHTALILSNSLNDTDERVLYDRLTSHKGGIVRLDSMDYKSEQFVSRFNELFTGLENGTLALIEDSTIYDRNIKLYGCHYLPKMFRRIKVSKRPILPGIQASLVAHYTPPEILKLLEYRMRVWYELGLTYGIFNHWKLKNMPALLGRELNTAGYECEDMFSNKLLKDFEQDIPSPFPIEFFQRLFCICLGMIGSGLVLLFYEIFYTYTLSLLGLWVPQKKAVEITGFNIESIPDERIGTAIRSRNAREDMLFERRSQSRRCSR